MLEGLDQVNWAQLDHAYGPATDLPALIRALVLPEPRIRAEAWDDLYSRVYHQGNICPALPAIVPFMQELLNTPNVPDKAALLRFLMIIISEDTTAAVCYLPDRDTQGWNPIKQQLQQVVGAGIQQYLDIVAQDPAPDMRAAALEVLAYFPEQQQVIGPALQMHLVTEPSIHVRAILINSLRLLYTHSPEQVAIFQAVAQSTDHPLVRLEAAIAVTNYLRQVTPVDVVVQLRAAGQGAVAIPTPPFNFPLADTVERAWETMQHLDPMRGVPLLLEVLASNADEMTRFDLVEAVLDLAFGGKHAEVRGETWGWGQAEPQSGPYGRWYDPRDVPRHIPPTHLETPEQQAAIRALVADDRLWHVHDDIYLLYGLPNTRDGLRDLLGAI